MANQIYTLRMNFKSMHKEEEMHNIRLGSDLKKAKAIYNEACKSALEDLNNFKKDFCIQTKTVFVKGELTETTYIKLIDIDCYCRVELTTETVGK